MLAALNYEQTLSLFSGRKGVIAVHNGMRSGIPITSINTLDEADKGSLIWISEKKENIAELISQTKASFIICGENYMPGDDADVAGKLIVVTRRPRLFFLSFVADMLLKIPVKPEIHPSAILHPKCRIGQNVSIGAGCIIGESAIGDNVRLFPNVVIYDNCKIGDNVIVNSNTVIGADGFGYERSEEGFIKFPHLGSVVIEDDVEIGSNTCIDVGTLGATFIGKGCKIDNLVHIAHNVHIGAHTAVIANAMIGGSVVIGPGSWIAPSASIRDGLKIGSNVTVGMAAVVTKNIEDNQVVAGNPAVPIEEFKKYLNKLKS